MINTELNEFVEKLKGLENHLQEKAIEIVKKEEEYITNYNKSQLFFDNKQSDGKPIQSVYGVGKGTYSKTTAQENSKVTFELFGRSKKKIAGQPYFLKQTGAFYDSFQVITKKDTFEIVADTLKTNDDGDLNDMRNIFGKNILGLNETNLRRLTEKKIIPQLYEDLNETYFI